MKFIRTILYLRDFRDCVIISQFKSWYLYYTQKKVRTCGVIYLTSLRFRSKLQPHIWISFSKKTYFSSHVLNVFSVTRLHMYHGLTLVLTLIVLGEGVINTIFDFDFLSLPMFALLWYCLSHNKYLKFQFKI